MLRGRQPFNGANDVKLKKNVRAATKVAGPTTGIQRWRTRLAVLSGGKQGQLFFPAGSSWATTGSTNAP